MQAWAKFYPRQAFPRKEPGKLYYPAEFGHIFEQYWDYLDDPRKCPNADAESSFTQVCFKVFATALSSMELNDFEPLVDSETDQSHVEIAKTAALSHLRLIQDACNFWGLSQEGDRSSPDTVSGGPAPDQDGHHVDA
jgi:hypothetical protein